MKREIKFRGKRKDNGEWVYGDLLTDQRKHWGTKQAWIFGDINHPVDPATVGQYTTEKDDELNEIYEGDILEIFCDSCEEKHIVEVKGDKCTLHVEVCGQDYDCTAIGWAVNMWDDLGSTVKVIGNIYDNPSLLEVSP